MKAWVLCLAVACGGSGVPIEAQSVTEMRTPPLFGAPLPGLGAPELARFEAGKAHFVKTESVEEGLGPIFNEASCVACHSAAAPGGSGARIVTRFGRVVDGAFDPMTSFGGSLLQDHAIPGFQPDRLPAEATIVAHRRTTPLFGLGLVDAVPDSVFVSLAATEHARDPSSAGTVAWVTELVSGKLAVGKFGWKAQNPTLFQFAGDAYFNEMGITNPFFTSESCPSGDCSLLAANPAPGLNDDGGDVAALADFMTYLAPPPAGAPAPAVFERAGCAQCHTPTLATRDGRALHPYSDFLLHDMGSLGDGIAQGAASQRQMRTAPLWGLRAEASLLHDGRTTSVDAAIRAHDGQGARARDAYLALPQRDRQALLDFLRAL